jgi:co-chaperonin GroES (HSP10)
MAINLTAIEGSLTPIKDHILVEEMHFGEQKTKSGLIIRNDDGETRGIYPRWGKVYAKGPENKDEYNVGDWILIEHGRWTRGILFNEEGNEKTLRRVDPENVLAYSNKKPDDVSIGEEYSHGSSATIPGN